MGHSPTKNTEIAHLARTLKAAVGSAYSTLGTPGTRHSTQTLGHSRWTVVPTKCRPLQHDGRATFTLMNYPSFNPTKMGNERRTASETSLLGDISYH